ncbi:MAG TPA: PIN domain-containing protein [Anaerolineae bacterium]|nr:PIN domain-containing protein [Anaerolineae bacterium]
MTCIVDSGFLYALVNRREDRHQDVAAVVELLKEPMILPISALTEVCYLIGRDLGPAELAAFVQSLADGDLILEGLTRDDLRRAAGVLAQYADVRVDFVDATIVALAERLKVTRILTLDRRHFELFRPRHCVAFEILP